METHLTLALGLFDEGGQNPLGVTSSKYLLTFAACVDQHPAPRSSGLGVRRWRRGTDVPTYSPKTPNHAPPHL